MLFFFAPIAFAFICSFVVESKVAFWILRFGSIAFFITFIGSFVIANDCRFNDFNFVACDNFDAKFVSKFYWLNILFYVLGGPIMLLLSFLFERRCTKLTTQNALKADRE